MINRNWCISLDVALILALMLWQEETREAKAEMGDYVKRGVKKTGEEGDWKKKTGDRGGWRRIAEEAVKKIQAAPHP